MENKGTVYRVLHKYLTHVFPKPITSFRWTVLNLMENQSGDVHVIMVMIELL